MNDSALPAKSSSELWNPGNSGNFVNTKPPLSRSPYNAGGYSNKLEYTPGDTPDPYRLGIYRQPNYSDVARGNDQNIRESETYRRPLPTAEDGHVKREFAPDPKQFRRGSGRYTESLNPDGYSSVRAFDKRTPPRFNGQHFSMATHKRTTEIYGMAPANKWRATRRAESVPHAVESYDTQQATPYLTGGAVTSPSLAPSSRNYLR